MPVPTAITDLSATAGSNSPAGSESPTSGDDYIRALSAFIRQIYDGALTERLRMTSDGRLYGTALHNNAGAVTGATNQYIASGTYTPTFTLTSNLLSATAVAANWMRVGNVVSVAMRFMAETSAALGDAEMQVSLPIASNFTSAGDLSGCVAMAGVVGSVGPVDANTASDVARMFFSDPGGTSSYVATFQYVVA